MLHASCRMHKSKGFLAAARAQVAQSPPTAQQTLPPLHLGLHLPRLCSMRDMHTAYAHTGYHSRCRHTRITAHMQLPLRDPAGMSSTLASGSHPLGERRAPSKKENTAPAVASHLRSNRGWLLWDSGHCCPPFPALRTPCFIPGRLGYHLQREVQQAVSTSWLSLLGASAVTREKFKGVQVQ